MRVLIADDDPIIRLDLMQMLSSIGYTVIAEAEDGRAAVEQSLALKPEVCVLDVKMPVMDGIDAAREISEAGVAPVVLLTAFSDREVVERASQAGVFGYLVKPFKPSDLGPAIEVARARFEQSLLLAQQIEDLNDRLDARKLIERAKGVLVTRDGLEEAEAYRLMQKASMNRRVSMRTVAEAILAGGKLAD
ncbi:MAG: response regulator [Fimbriimonadaceae bacterium]|nr:response regulator [Fimbriimonadaceae bacterium]